MIEKSCSITRDCAKGVLVVNFFLFFASYSWLTQVWCVGTTVDGGDARRRSSGCVGTPRSIIDGGNARRHCLFFQLTVSLKAFCWPLEAKL